MVFCLGSKYAPVGSTYLIAHRNPENDTTLTQVNAILEKIYCNAFVFNIMMFVNVLHSELGNRKSECFRRECMYVCVIVCVCVKEEEELKF